MFEVDKEDKTIWMYDVIGDSFFGGISAGMFQSAVGEFDKSDDLSLRINSGGGVIDEAFAMYNIIRQHRGKVTAYVDAIAASSASYLIMAADEIVMAKNSLLMIHKPYGMAGGDADEFRKIADVLDKYQGNLEQAYVDRTGLDRETINTLMNDETWFTADEGMEKGFIDRVDDVDYKLENKDLSSFGYKHNPLNSTPEKDQQKINRINYLKMKIKLRQKK